MDRLPAGRRDEVLRLRASTSSRSSRRPAARRRSSPRRSIAPVSGPIWWSADGKTPDLRGRGRPRRATSGARPTAGGAVEKLTTGRRTVSNVSLGADGELALLAGSTTETPRGARARGRQRCASSRSGTTTCWRSCSSATTEDFTSKSKDGTVVNGLLVKPASLRRREEVPDAALHPRRPERAGRPLVRLRARVLRGQRLRRAAR